MDYNDSWEVTIVPSVTSQITSSNDTIALSTRALSTISERESKDFCLSFDGNKRKKDTYKNAEGSKITSLSPTCQKLNHDYSHCSLKSDKQLISTLQRNKKKSYDKINKEDIHSQTCEDMNNASDALFIELGAVYKILDFITDSNPEVSTLTNNCCNEISRTLQCLLVQRHDKKLEDLLLKDSSLHRCERCGVISYILGSHPTIEKIKKNRSKTKYDNEIIIAERDCINNDQNSEKLEILSPPNLINNAESRINNSKINNQAEYKDELSETELLSTDKLTLLMQNCIKSLNEANMSITKADSNTIKNKFYPDNNTIKKLFTDLETEKKNKRYECNHVARNIPGKYESSNAMKVYASTDREEVVREISYEPKSQIDELLARDRRSSIAQTVKVSQRMLDKHGDIYPIVDTVKYLARGQFTELDRKENELFSKLQERRCTRLDNARNGGSSVLYGSREDYPQRGAGFWLFDESGHLLQIPLDDCLPIPRTDNNRVNVSANISQYSHTTEKMKVGNQSNYMEKDSLEDCTLLKQREESNVTILSSSSVENLIRGSLDRKYAINDEDIPRGRKLVSSRPSLDISRHVRAQIAKDRRSGKAKESIGDPRTHDSHISVRLSPETRRKICHLIKTIVSSNKDSTFFQKKYLSNETLNSEKLLHSKSANAALAHSNKCCKIDNEKTNICADDCIPTKLSELPEDKNLLRRQDNFVNTRNQYVNKSLSKDSVKIFHDDTTLVSSDKCADNCKKKIVRQIVYKDAALKNITGNDDGHREILLFYRKILENSEDMDWENFRKFVEILHPDERELWCDVCRTISEEMRRIGGDAYDNTEICIEISPVNPEETLKAGKVMMCAQEIVFELDMTLKNVENFLNKKLAKERLDTHNDAEDAMNWSSRQWETILKQPH